MTDDTSRLVQLDNTTLIPVQRAPFACSLINEEPLVHPYKQCIHDVSAKQCKTSCDRDSECILARYIDNECLMLRNHPDYAHVLTNIESMDVPDTYVWYDPVRLSVDPTLVNVVFAGVFVYLYSEPHYIGVNTMIPRRIPTEKNPYPVMYPLIGTDQNSAQSFKLVLRYSNWGVVFKPLVEGLGFSISLPLTTLSLVGVDSDSTDNKEVRLVQAEQPVVDEQFIFTFKRINDFNDNWIRYDEPLYLYHPSTQRYVHIDDNNSTLSTDKATVFVVKQK